MRQMNLDDDYNEDNLRQVIEAQQVLDMALRREEKFWFQKSHC